MALDPDFVAGVTGGMLSTQALFANGVNRLTLESAQGNQIDNRRMGMIAEQVLLSTDVIGSKAAYQSPTVPPLPAKPAGT